MAAAHMARAGGEEAARAGGDRVIDKELNMRASGAFSVAFTFLCPPDARTYAKIRIHIRG